VYGQALEHFLAREAGIASNPGHGFGREGVGFARLNIACPRSVMMKALERLARAVDRLGQGG
jgi:cystathionine beta-lyase